MGKNWDKFKLLIWKNWLLQWRHPLQTGVEIIAPVLFSALLVLIRSLVNPEQHDTIFFPEFDALQAKFNFSSANSTLLAYSPSGNAQLDKIMQTTATNLNLIALPFNSSEQMEYQLQDETYLLYILAGLQFANSLATNDTLPTDLEVAIRFPSELRSGDLNQIVRTTWRTNLLFPVYQTAGPRTPTASETASPDYYNEGFLAVQLAFSKAFIEHISNNDSIPAILMQRYPYPSWINDPLLTALQSFVGIVIMLSFVYTCINTVKVITTEKEKQLKEAMKIMGLPNWLHWTAWFIKTFTFLLLSIILMVVLLKVSWYPGTNFSVFTLSDASVIFIFLLLYICATITFCFAISVFFSKANTSAAVAGMVWFLSYAPYLFLQDQYDTTGVGVKLICSLGSNTAMAYGFQLMLMYEGTGEGLQWSNMWESVTPDDSLTLGYIMLMLILDTFLYLLIALYVEAVFPGEYGVPKEWYFPFTSSFWCGQPRSTGIENVDIKSNTNNEFFEKEPTYLKPGIKVVNLRKVFGKNKTAVRDISLNMYENQITVLLGHNGAGKTTTMSMLTGILTPTSGTAIVGDHNIRTDMDQVRESLGLCPQHNIIFEELTVREHLYFFSKLKGMNHSEIEGEIQKYVELLELVPKADAKSSTLSGGMKRKLCVGMALCGNSKVVMLDEPTAGMDPSARRALWDLLQAQKAGRTMLLTTHFMDEADLLGDRIAIMAGGQLQCCGSSFFLKKKYGAGYHLIMDKTEKCDVTKVTNLLKKHIPDIHVDSNVGSELTYLLNEDQSSVFERMFRDLENNSEELGITSYGVSLTTLEEVFMKVGADHGQEETNNVIEAEKNGHYKIIHNNEQPDMNRSMSSVTKLEIGENNFLTGFKLWQNQILAMLMKKILSTVRSWILLLVQIIIPVVFLIIAIVVTRANDTSRGLPELPVTLDSYDNPVTVVNGTGSYKQQLVTYFNESGHSYTDLDSQSLEDYMIQKTTDEVSTVRQRYIVGATFSDDNVKVWFNNQPYHSPPLALALGVNSIIKSIGSNFSLSITNYPLPFTLSTRFTQISQGNSMGFQLAFNIGFSMAFVASFYVLFYVRERVTKAKHLQFVSGVDISTFWLTSFVCDMITFIFTSLCLIITLVAFQEDGFKTFNDIGRVFLLLVCFGYTVLPLHFLASYLFEVPSTGYTRMTLFNIFTGVAAFLTVQILGSEGLNLEHVADILDWIFLILPHYCLSSGIYNLYMVFQKFNICQNFVDICLDTLPLVDSELCWNYTCNYYTQCCDVKQDYFTWEEPGVGRNLFFAIIVGTVLISLLLFIEYGFFKKLIYALKKNAVAPPVPIIDEDSDVTAEKEKIRRENLSGYTLVLKDLTKYYKKFLAVNGLCLGVKPYECFGLLGINGAGKTTTFKMMTGDVKISYGDGYVNGFSLKTDLKKVHKQIGYCPQFDAVLDDLTGKETLIMFCLLRGITFSDSKIVADNLAKEFDFYRHLDKKVKEYSGGNKRKLSTAIALIGDPPVIYLDEPTTGMDPATKRYLWNALCRIRDTGKCIVLTSHSMEECEALCTRLAIMVNGNFKCLGSTQHLKSKFSDGYTLTIKIKKSGDYANVSESEIDAVDNFVKQHFPTATIREKYQELLTYYITDKSIKWSKMFGIMERGKREINIEDYSIGQASLEQVFLTFTKLQRTED